jgi:hypothetical protein
MPFDTYTNLLTSIDNWLGQRVELQPIYPDFVVLAERRMYRDLRAREMIRRVVALLNETWEFLPYDFIRARRVTVNPGTQTNTACAPIRLTGMSTGQLEAQYAGQSQAVLPEAYAIEGLQIRFGPAVVAQAVPTGVNDPTPYRNFEMVYYARFPPLNATDTSTNNILDIYPELYLYGALIEAEPYLIDDQRIAVWKGMYDDAVARINIMSEYDASSALTMGLPEDVP